MRNPTADSAGKLRFKAESLEAIMASLHHLVRLSSFHLYSWIHEQVLCHSIWNFDGTMRSSQPPWRYIKGWRPEWWWRSGVTLQSSQLTRLLVWVCLRVKSTAMFVHSASRRTRPRRILRQFADKQGRFPPPPPAASDRRLRPPPSSSTFQLCSAACQA